MFFIGIDVGKFNHCGAVLNSEAEVLVQPFFSSKITPPALICSYITSSLSVPLAICAV